MRKNETLEEKRARMKRMTDRSPWKQTNNVFFNKKKQDIYKLHKGKLSYGEDTRLY